MNKEKKLSLEKYKVKIQESLSSPVPEKQKNRMHQYKQFLNRELEAVTNKLKAAELEGVK